MESIKYNVSVVYFFLSNPLIAEDAVLKSPLFGIFGLICDFKAFSVCFMNLCAVVRNVNMFRFIISS